MTEFSLVCGVCDHASAATPLATLCTECNSPQLVRYPVLEKARSDLSSAWKARPRGMWRFREVMPLHPGEEPVSIGEGDTPLVTLPRFGDTLDVDLRLKDEGGNPTGSFKDRGLSAAVTRAVHDGATSLVLPSAGNAGVALAAYATRAGLPATIFIPVDTPDAVLKRCRAYGADVVTVDGLISECGARAAAFAKETGAFDLATLREPYRIEGKKTMGLEILEALDWRAPDAIVYPTGGGTGLIGSWKAILEAVSLGLVREPKTRMFAVQATGCAPIVRAWESGTVRAETWTDAVTRAWGLRVPSARGDQLILQAIRQSGGAAITVDDDAMLQAARRAGELDGAAVGIEGGATLAAARALKERGLLRPGETVVAFNTGNLTNYGWYSS